ncbi:hypothetical protein ACMU_01665 [Actibacterium mucosum KCTC 23349]|uniref:DNA 3'-5' helicase n=1 Tax=Actibacterium mucosum KCTC 23349 TaxID=1454373 RepID=A0A037ZQT4_9RHOB|nr:double-strand break repair helicase AddA [Actibacterium mucosum]KAJ57227.1 hypothetical protein ACMU_01665 [Actibacterium mucosum KCTC 23349]
MKRDPATERQVQAADPMASTWLSANAGSGKTRVLTDRVARLLLSGVRPQHILCLTYTKAAASEMQNRLFKRLGEWAMLDEGTLRANLEQLGLDDRVDSATIAEARRLFARAIETPGGLKIQTIHSFCASLLRRFPLEAGVSPQFTEMDDRTAAQLHADIVEHIAEDQPDLFARFATWFTGDSLHSLTSEITKNADELRHPADAARVFSALNLSGDVDEAAIIDTALNGSESAFLAEFVPVLASQSAMYAKFGAALAAVQIAPLNDDGFAQLCDLFLQKSGTEKGQSKSSRWPQSNHKKVREALEPWLPQIHAWMDRVAAANAQLRALTTAHKTLALHEFAASFITAYDSAKQARGWLDFDDLITKTRDLLVRPGVAEWVLYRLDGGIDHILVDEAQDTSPLQWQVIDLLAQEFTAGQGARGDTQRTIFVVGDKKQSIYSFQGADPGGFDRMQDHFGQRLIQVGAGLTPLQLEYSFRSAPAILRVVDQTFLTERQGVGDFVSHHAFKETLPGRVDLWPPVEKAEADEAGDWTDPVDLPTPEHHTRRLATQIATEILRLTQEESLFDGKTARPVQPGDVLILMQRRSQLFHEVIRACKTAGLPIAGADRLKIGGELAVKDIMALLSFLALPEDSLSLASALKSPLFGWDEDQLFRLAAPRREAHLWPTLRAKRATHAATTDVLDDLLGAADFLRPYELIERILTRHGGRKRLIARLGDEAIDGIDALLSMALSYERQDVPSLTGFIQWMASDDPEIKRQLDSAGNRVRVMTVHGSKGLEAPIVFLPDTGKRRTNIREEILKGADGLPLWKPNADMAASQITDARNALAAKEAEERQRLLYVAMTRAEQWLIVGVGGDHDDPAAWYTQIAAGMEGAGAVRHDFGFGEGQRYQTGDWVAASREGPASTPETALTLPEWAKTGVEPPPRPPLPKAPSDLGGAKALPGTEAEAPGGTEYGSALHLLLEYLPEAPRDTWQMLADSNLPPELADAALADAVALLDNPKLSQVFGPDSRAEVPLTAMLSELGEQIMGAVDRLIVTPEKVTAVDFKSNRITPDSPKAVPEGILRQMGAYAVALRKIFPDRDVETAILWTRPGNLMPLPSQLVVDALERAATS